jgi:hypothetical protein
VKERPILFSSPMVRALLDGTKTQTRRVVKLPHANPLGGWEPTTFGGTDARGGEHDEQVAIWHTRTGETIGCPYGLPGDRLWVKETWRPFVAHSCSLGACDCGDVTVRYAADNADRLCRDSDIVAASNDWSMPKAAARGNVSPLFMPRWAARITLEITAVRVQRLQEISFDDARDEGVRIPVDEAGHALIDISSKFAPAKYLPKPDPGSMTFRPRQMGKTTEWHLALLRAHFASLWDEINGAGAWAANPWVWAVTFQRLESKGC